MAMGDADFDPRHVRALVAWILSHFVSLIDVLLEVKCLGME